MVDDSVTNPLDEAILSAPIAAQIELGSITLLADDWARLQVGDILAADEAETKRVIVRVGGRAVAWGELVMVEDRVGVRVLRLATARTSQVQGEQP